MKIYDIVKWEKIQTEKENKVQTKGEWTKKSQIYKREFHIKFKHKDRKWLINLKTFYQFLYWWFISSKNIEIFVNIRMKYPKNTILLFDKFRDYSEENGKWNLG